ncbi:hypothetical protein SAMN04487936_10258 [Halobacillus dabanensis]|uniref:Uncharacterized protein n=1 Tax=Halobacillus dabanensis TaxID=240302 RepID=A0A1I3R4C0_HALDA|nr:hypothetical protein [Halobacillus dabanensis]SFJ40602.1 hypothetical protein SAMN04487936_10258 [Halobacillus dabanensis]
MKKVKQKLVWLLPTMIVLIGISLLFSQNYDKVTQPPDEEWSRELDIGKTPVLRRPNVSSQDGQPTISFLTEQGIQQNFYDKDFNMTDQVTYDVPVDKFTQFYINGNRMIYADYYSLYDEKTGDKITDIQSFYPLESQALYMNDQKLFAIEMDNLESTELLTIENTHTKLLAEETQSGTYLLTSEVTKAGNQLNYYMLENNEVEKLGESQFSLNDSEEIRDIQFTIHDDTLKLLVSTVLKQSASGKMQNFYYYSEGPVNENPNLSKVTFNDPFTDGELREVSDIKIQSLNKGSLLFFKAIGATETTFRESDQFNIYQAQIQSEGQSVVTRLSNTPELSNFPVSIDDRTVVWVDQDGEGHRLLLASQNSDVIEKADQITKRSLLHALGKTMGMLSYSLFTFLISIFWFLWPLLFIIILMFIKKDALDQDRPWVLYSGILIYLVAAVLVRDPMFPDALNRFAPSYLSFPGSPLFFLLGFALLSYGILRTGAKVRDWSIPIQLTYFISMHVLFIAVFFGPYLSPWQ